jgi:uncharacterized protein (TIGR01777 family)
MDVAITGASGLIGSALGDALRVRGDRVVTVGRGPAAAVRWDPMAGTIDADTLEGMDAVVHLAGESLGEKKWTPEQKQKIMESRVQGTELLATTIAGLRSKPAVLVSASAVGFYGDRGDEELTETSPPPPPGNFLSDVCVAWEAATANAEAAGIRTVHVRTGIVLSKEGGALARMLLPFKLGLGGRIGSGRQYMSWVSIDDEVGALVHAVDTDTVRGPLNATGPRPVTNAEFTKALGAAVHRPTVLPTPLAPLKVVYGAELVQRVLVEGQRVLPAGLEASGYEFRHPTLAAAFEAALA